MRTAAAYRLFLPALLIGLAGCSADRDAARDRPVFQAFSPLPYVGCAAGDDGSGDPVARYLSAVGEGSAEDAGRALVAAHRRLRCMSAADFAATYDRMIRQVATSDAGIEVAPLVFLFLDSGGYLIDRRAAEWLGDRATALATALSSRTPAMPVGFAYTAGLDLVRLDRARTIRLTGSFATNSWKTTRCSYREMIPLTGSDRLVCLASACPALESLVEIEDLELERRQLEELCEQTREAIEGALDVDRESLVGCFEAYAESQESGHHLCIRDVALDHRPVDAFFEIAPELAVEVSRDCMLGDVQTEEEVARSRLEREKEELEREERELRDLETRMNESGRRVSELMKTRPASDPVVQAEVKQFSRLVEEFFDEKDGFMRLREIEKRQKEIEEELAKLNQGTMDCAPDGTGCSDTCGPRDQLMEALRQCVVSAAESGPQGPDPAAPPEPVDPESPPVDPRVIEPLPDSVVADPAFAALTDCIAAATGAGSGDEDDCGRRLVCAGQEEPVRDEDGRCVCPGGPLPDGGLSCDTLIDCSADGECTCPDDPEVTAPAPGVPVDPRVLFTIRTG